MATAEARDPLASTAKARHCKARRSTAQALVRHALRRHGVDSAHMLGPVLRGLSKAQVGTARQSYGIDSVAAFRGAMALASKALQAIAAQWLCKAPE